MDGELSERRLIENEVIIKELNQRTIKGLTELKELAYAHQQENLAPDTSQPLQFYCECSTENCGVRITISPEEYEKAHQDSRHFTIAKGHATPKIEKTIKRTTGYDIVEKYLEPSRVLSE